MPDEIGYDELCKMILGAVEQIRQHSDELCLLDAEVGDGDHGITMRRAFDKAAEVIAANPGRELSPLLNDIAWALMGIDGGATGPLYGSIFLGMADSTAGKTVLFSEDFAAMFAGALAEIQQQTKAKIGDKTLMDALIPAVEAIQAQVQTGAGCLTALKAGTEAAARGSEFTRSIPARFGRAKYQGERTLGKVDPGSVSMTYVLQGFVNGLEHVSLARE